MSPSATQTGPAWRDLPSPAYSTCRRSFSAPATLRNVQAGNRVNWIACLSGPDHSDAIWRVWTHCGSWWKVVPKGGCAVTSAAAGAAMGAGADPPPGAGTTSMRPTDVASAPTTTAVANPRARRSTRRYRQVTALRPTTWLPLGRTVMRLLVGGERDLALLLEAGAVATARDAVLRLAGRVGHLPAAGTDPVDHADHQLARAHGFTPGL